MCWNNFVCGLGEHQVTNLWTGVDVVNWLEGMSVPETDASIGCTSTSGKEARLVGIPSDSFDGSLMLAELGDGLLTV